MSDLKEKLEGIAYQRPVRIRAIVQKPAVGVHALVEHAVVEAGLGLVGDHRKKDWCKGKRIPEREVTAISIEVLEALGSSPEVPGANLILEGMDLRMLAAGQRIRVGIDVVLQRAVKNHRPCHLFARRISEEARAAVSEANLRCALFSVISGGEISVGDPVILEENE